MKTIIMAAMLAAAPLLAAAQKSVTIENPVVAGKSVFTQGLFVEKVEASKAATKIYFKMYHGWAEGWAQISGESFISANGKSLQQISVDGVPINEHFFGKGDNFTSEFSITFPPVDKGVDAVDYIECSGPTCFRIFGIPLTQEASSRNKAEQERLEAEFSKESKVSDDGKPLPGNRLMIGQSTLKGRLAGFRKTSSATRKSRSCATSTIRSPETRTRCLPT